MIAMKPGQFRISLFSAVAIACLLSLSTFAQEGYRVFESSGDGFPPQGISVAIFGSTGTVGDGVLKSVLADPRVGRIVLVTRRETDRITAAREAGRVDVVMHKDYLDYSVLADVFADIDAVYWALGTSTRNVDDDMYTVIHVDFPVAFLEFWLQLDRDGGGRSFHLVSGAGTSADSWFHWAREKAKAEEAVASLAEGTGVTALLYRPSFVAPASERISGFESFMRSILMPLGKAVDAPTIGCAMLANTFALPARSEIYENDAILERDCPPAVTHVAALAR